MAGGDASNLQPWEPPTWAEGLLPTTGGSAQRSPSRCLQHTSPYKDAFNLTSL